MLADLELHVHAVHRYLLLVVIPEEDLEQTFDLTVWPLRSRVLPDEADLDVDIFIDDALVALNERVYVEAREFLLQELLLEVLLELTLH